MAFVRPAATDEQVLPPCTYINIATYKTYSGREQELEHEPAICIPLESAIGEVVVLAVVSALPAATAPLAGVRRCGL